MTTIIDLPDELVMKICLLLPVKSVIMMKPVSKECHRILNDPFFVEQHHSEAGVCPLIRSVEPTRFSRVMSFIEPGKFNGNSFGVDPSLKPILKVPVLNLDMAMKEQYAANSKHRFRGDKKEAMLQLLPRVYGCNIVNSCKGLVCLADSAQNFPRLVYQPMTGEYIELPKQSKRPDEMRRATNDCALGFDQRTNQFKVICIYRRVQESHCLRGAEINVIGTGIWRRIEQGRVEVVPSYLRLDFPTYLEGRVYWLHFTAKECTVLCFLLDEEDFVLIPPPPIATTQACQRSIGVHNENICMVDTTQDRVDVWVLEQFSGLWHRFYSVVSRHRGLYQPMGDLKTRKLLMFNHADRIFTAKECTVLCFLLDEEDFVLIPPPPIATTQACQRSIGVHNENICMVDTTQDRVDVWVLEQFSGLWHRFYSVVSRHRGLYQPMGDLKTRKLLMFNHADRIFASYDLEREELVQCLCIHCSNRKIEVHGYTPSLKSINESIEIGDAMVFNIYNRCAGLKLQGDEITFSVREA